MKPLFLRGLGQWVLGTDKRQRLRATQVLLTLALDLVLSVELLFAVGSGLLPWQEVMSWIGFTLCGVLCFYVAVRSGFNLRFDSDPALTLQQGVFSVMSTLFAYVICGPVRGASLLTMAVTLIFGMFALSPRQVRGLSLGAVVVLGATMVYCNARWPERYPAAEEAMHFMLVATVFPSIAVLAGQLSTMRHKLRQHRLDLEAALEQNRQLAIRDELTGLYNRRYLMEAMHQEVARAARLGRPLCLALLDIDHFKRINDNHGHAHGDEVLRTFARTAGDSLRESDILGRWGGEEFLVMLPETQIENAASVIERVRERLAAVCFDQIDQGLRVSFSAGIALCQPGEALAAAIERADQAMYAAKQGGRNRSVVSEAPRAAVAARPVASEPQAVPS